MKKLIFAILFCFTTSAMAADTEISDLTADAAPGTDSIVVTIDDPAGTPASRRSTIGQLLGASANMETDGTIQWEDAGALDTAGELSDSDLLDVAALTTTAYGLALLEVADEAALKTLINAEAGTDFLAPDGDGSALTAVDAATGDSATAFFDAGTIEHEYGGLEGDISAYTGVVAITGGATAEVDSKSELEGHLADVSDIAEADGDTWTGNHDFGGATYLKIPTSNANPAASGHLRYDTTVTNFTSGALRWMDSSGTETRQILDIPSDIIEACGDDEVIAYDAAIDELYCMVAPGAAGGDSITVDTAATVDADFLSTADIDFILTGNDITANINAGVIDPEMLATATAKDAIQIFIENPVAADIVYLMVPFTCTITGAFLLADVSGSAVVDVWVDIFANHPPTNADSITASAPITLSSQDSAETTRTGWTDSLTQGHTMAFNVDSASTLTKLTVVLEVER